MLIHPFIANHQQEPANVAAFFEKITEANQSNQQMLSKLSTGSGPVPPSVEMASANGTPRAVGGAFGDVSSGNSSADSDKMKTMTNPLA